MGLLCDGDDEPELVSGVGMVGCGGGKEARREVSGLQKWLEMTDLPLKLIENSSLTDVNRR